MPESGEINGIQRAYRRAVTVQSLCPIWRATHITFSPALSACEAKVWRIWYGYRYRVPHAARTRRQFHSRTCLSLSHGLPVAGLWKPALQSCDMRLHPADELPTVAALREDVFFVCERMREAA